MSSSQVRGLESGMKEFELSSKLGIGNGGFRAKFQCLESGKEEFETSSKLGIRNGGVRAKFEAWNRKWRSSSQVLVLESVMEEFQQSSDSWNREWKSSRQVRGFESGMEKFEPNSNLGIGNGGDRAKFRCSIVAPPLRHSCRSQTALPTHGNGACPLRHLH